MDRERSRPDISQVPTAATSVLFQSIVTAPVLLIGLLGALQDTRQTPPAAVWSALHVSFGVLLCTSIVVQFVWRVTHVGFRSTSDIAAYARLLTRKVFILLYGLVGVKEIQCLLGSIGPTRQLRAESMRDLQCYVLYGLLALALIRIVAALCLRWTMGSATASSPVSG
jgi:hypothetical protein